jgi:N4-(beta-N-acetylglucosaminyl)-L-asparaginase
MLLKGADTLDAALHVCKTQEDDPKDHSTGLGGLPNMRGEVQLDACCLHGPTRRSAAVAAVPGIRNASALARLLMEQTGNSLLVGSDAHAFALSHGVANEDLLTERTRNTYALWKQIQSDPKLLGSGIYDPAWPESVRKQHFMPNSQRDLDSLIQRLEPLAVQTGIGPEATWRAVFDAVSPAAEPIYVSTIDRKGQLSSACTSSGMPWRMPGASSDVAVIGAGCFVDPDVGSAGSSGNAEANIKIAGAHTIIENMRMGMSPEDAGMDALRRIVRWHNNDMTALRFVEMIYYILRKDGAYASVSLWRGDRTGHIRQFTISDGEQMRRTEDCLSLFQCSPTTDCSETRTLLSTRIE